MSKALDVGFAILKNDPNGIEAYSDDDIVNRIADEFLSTAVAFLEQDQEDYIMRVFGNDVPDVVIEAGRSQALRRLVQCIRRR